MSRNDDEAAMIDLGETRSYAPRRRTHVPLRLALLAGVVIAAVMFTGGRIGAGGGSASPPATESATGPRLFVPVAASAGERIPVVAYRLRGRCGATELRLDGGPVAHRLTRYGGAPGEWTEVVLTLDIPVTATAGRHAISLVISRCEDPARQLATADITIAVGAGIQGSAVIGSSGANGSSSNERHRPSAA
jgi:hypothetical protein